MPITAYYAKLSKLNPSLTCNATNVRSNGSDLRREKFSMPAVFRYQPSIVHKLLAERVIGVDAQYMAEVLAFKFNHNYKHKLYPISEEDEIEDDAEDAHVVGAARFGAASFGRSGRKLAAWCLF